MGTTTTFNTLKLADGFLAAGFDEKKAKALAEKFGELANKHLVTREYLDSKFGATGSKVKSDILCGPFLSYLVRLLCLLWS